MPNIGQVSYSLYPAQAEPGMLGDNTVNRIESYPAIESINPGRLVELNADGASVQQVQGTGNATYTAGFGFSILLTAREGTGASNVSANTGSVFVAGDMVPVLRKGSLFAEWKGTTQVANGTPNVYHSSTVATDRGKLTDAATSATAGSEVSTAAAGVRVRAPVLAGTGNIVLVDVNFN